MLMLTDSQGGPGPIRRFLLPGLFVFGLFVALYMRRPAGGYRSQSADRHDRNGPDNGYIVYGQDCRSW